MASSERNLNDEGQIAPSTSLPSSSSFSDDWKERILYPTILAGIVGAGVGLASKHRKVNPNIYSDYAANFSIVAASYCAGREFARVTRKSEPDDMINSALGGFASGALLGRLQGGQKGAIRYSVCFALGGTLYDYTSLKLKPILKSYRDQSESFKLPEWSPIRVLDEEALAEKKARELKLFGERAQLGNLSKEES